ncbi:MAG: 50S ribosomal protein L11 methyltransferase [Acidobacteria bacterium]|nr:50S ribosomal protein L11 methyltransferase [Acidobacteriota bacterium]
MSKSWYSLDVMIEASAREAVEYALMEAGALGTQSFDAENGRMIVVAYFDAPPQREVVRAALFEALTIYGLPSSAVRGMNFREVADRDWLGEWKRGWQPVEVGRRFVIAPPWSEVAETPDRIIIRIEPGMAFGTGTHETTRLCLAAIEKYFDRESFLDVGTGTGILAIAAAKLSPGAHIAACDTDAEAVSIARENARLNGVAESISFSVGTIDETATASANLVCANLTADVIVPLLPRLIAATCGRLVLSGILQEQVGMIEASLSQNGIGEFELETDGEWVAIIV